MFKSGFVLLFNFGEEDFVVKEGDRIAQLIIEKISILDIEEVDDQIRVHNICKSKFNGELVMQLTSLTGKELGSLMKLLKPLTTDDVVYNMNEQEIKNLIVNTYANFKYV